MVIDMLDERSKQVLYAIVQSYINNPEPVGSRFVTKAYSFGLSPATIRNIMADLADLGFLNQPHTSAGRIPTDKGYRFYVDSIADPNSSRKQDAVLEDVVRQFANKLGKMRTDINTMFSEVTSTLSATSNYVGIAIPPRPEQSTFRKIDLIKFKGDNVAAILLTEEGVIKNKMFATDPGLTQEDLNRIADYLNAEYSGYTLDEIEHVLVKRIKQEKLLWDKLISRAIRICEQAMSFGEDDIFVSGIYDVMDLPDFSDLSRLREISKAIRDRHLILRLLTELSDAEGVQVIIGDENPVAEMKKFSIVASPYKEGNRPMGVIALIGPTRMDYLKAMYMVDKFAKCISKTFD